MYTIMGSSGNTGKLIVRALLRKGKRVRVVCRNESKLKDLVDKGAEPVVGKILNTKFLTKAFEGATAVYVMIPPNSWTNNIRGYQNAIARNIARVIEKTGIKYVVALSSVGAHLSEKGGIVQGLYDMEQRLNKINGLNVLYLRASYYMENILDQIITIKQKGMMGSLLRADFKLPIVATRDIAKFAVQQLLKLDFKGTGNVQYILGPRDVTYKEIARVLGRAINKPDLNYVEFSYADAKRNLQRLGISENVAGVMNEFMESINEGRVLSDVKRTSENTTRTSLEEFAPVFARVYNRN